MVYSFSFCVLDIFQFPVNLISGVSRAWPAWLVPWAPLWRGRKNCLAQIKICDLTFSSTSICVPYKQPLLYHQFQQGTGDVDLIHRSPKCEALLCLCNRSLFINVTFVVRRAGLKRRGARAPGQFSLEGPYDVFCDVIVCKICFRWFATFSFAFSGSGLCACRIYSIVSRLCL